MPNFEIIADLEHAISSLPEEDRDAARRASKKILLDCKTTETKKTFSNVKQNDVIKSINKVSFSQKQETA